MRIVLGGSVCVVGLIQMEEADEHLLLAFDELQQLEAQLQSAGS